MSAKRKTILATLLVVVGLLVWFLALPMVRFSAARKKYVVGMPLERAQSIAKPPFETHFDIPYPVSAKWIRGEMPEEAKRTIVVGILYSPKECVVLRFNSYSNLVEIQPVNDAVDFVLWLRSKNRTNKKGI